MRYAAGHKQETRARIVAAAGRGFRRHGVDGFGVAAVMREVGLTHGGFYAHFRDKDALVCAACERAFADIWAGVDGAARRAPAATVRAITTAYLSPEHRAGLADGCLIAALGPELVRGSPAVRRMVARIVSERLSSLSANMPGRTPQSRRDAATLLISLLVGTIVVSRLLAERDGRRSLAVTRRVIDGVTATRAGRTSRRSGQ